MHCWNALSPEQQEFLRTQGYLSFGYEAEGGTCDKPAEVEVATMWDEFPGPRFYCIECAVAWLEQVRATAEEVWP